MRPLAIIPILLFLALAGVLGYRLLLVEQGNTPDLIPSVLIDKPAPAFALPGIEPGQAGLALADIEGKVALVNFFASWCVPCRIEHPLLAGLARTPGLTLVGINYKDKPEDAGPWLKRLGNPFAAIGADREGRVAIDFGVYGVPESYLIDREGRIRYKQVGPLSEAAIKDTILPLVAELNR